MQDITKLHLSHALPSIILLPDETSSLSSSLLMGGFHCRIFWANESKSGAEENSLADIAADEIAL